MKPIYALYLVVAGCAPLRLDAQIPPTLEQEQLQIAEREARIAEEARIEHQRQRLNEMKEWAEQLANQKEKVK